MDEMDPRPVSRQRPIRGIVMLWLFMAAVVGMIWVGTGCRSASTLYLRGHEDGYAAYWQKCGGKELSGYELGWKQGFEMAETLDKAYQDR